MVTALALDETLLPRLPLPLAQLYRRAHNAKTPLERHLTAFYVWEATLKLLGCVAVAAYAQRPEHNPQLAERLHNLARPALGHWWEFVRRLLPILADGGVAGFAPLRDLLLGRSRDDLPRAAGLDAALRGALEDKPQAQAAVRVTELLDRLVRYRNQEIGHGAAGQQPGAFYERMAAPLLAGVAELLGKVDLLAGRQLCYVSDVEQKGGRWLVQRYELCGESARRREAWELPRAAADRLPDGQRVYLHDPAAAEPLAGLWPVHPLLLYDAEADEVLFLGARRGRQRTEYLSYTSGRTLDLADAGEAQAGLLATVLGMPVAAEQVAAWAAQSQAEEPAAEAEPGPARRTLGEYELLSELGQGGMGVVYRAWQPSLGRQVALKRLLQSGDTRTEARFRREIRALGRVEHPHLVKVFTSGSDGEHWFYVMELVEGVPLAAVCDRLQASASSAADVDLPTWQAALNTVCAEARQQEKPLSDPATGPLHPVEAPASAAPADTRAAPTVSRSYVAQVVELVRQVTTAAHALHEARVLHRDIKPGNILVTADGQQAMLVDLGLAQLADDVEGRLTRTRQFVGTLRYASPEQLGGATLDARADVYSLGATLWELLALAPLFGVTEQTPTPDLMLKIQQAEPERLRRLHPGLSRDLEAIVHRCLEKDARQRYATAAELARDLERYQAGEPVRARPVRGWERGWKWVKRRPAAAALAALSVLMLLALVAVGVGLFFGSRLQTANENLEAALQEARTERGKAETAQVEEKQQRQLAVAAQAEEKKQRERAEQAERELQQRAYDTAMLLTQVAWEQHHVGRFLQLLEENRPHRKDEEDRRGFEWFYWKRQFQRGHVTLQGHTDRVWSVAYSPDGKRLASASVDRTVKVWDAQTGQAALTLQGHTDRVWSVAYSPDGKRLASASADRTVKVWDAQTGQVALTLQGHTGPVRSVVYSPDGKRLASASADRTVKVWDAQTGQVALTLQGHTDWVYSVAYSPDGKRLASASADRTVKVWDAQTGQVTLTLKGHTDCVYGVAYSPDGKRLASASADRTVKVWDAQTGQAALTLQGHTDYVTSVAYSPDGNRLASGSLDRTVKVWDAQTGQVALTLKGHADYLYGVAYSPDGKRLASAGADQTVKVWDVQTGQETLTLKGYTSPVNGVAYSPDGTRLASASTDKTVKVWDAQTGQVALTLQGHTDWVYSVAYSPDGKRLASASWDKTVKVWDAQTGQQVLTLKGHTGPVTSVAYSPDGQRLASASTDKTVKVWDAQAGQVALTLQGHTGPVKGVAYSPDGQRLASASADQTVKVWDAQTGQVALILQGHTGPVTSVAYSPDGQRFASASADETVKVWSAQTGQVALTLQGHSNYVWSVAFSPDSKRLASASLDQTVKVWDVQTGQETLTLKGHSEYVMSVAFSPDGKRLASASMDKTVKVWEAQTIREAPNQAK